MRKFKCKTSLVTIWLMMLLVGCGGSSNGKGVQSFSQIGVVELSDGGILFRTNDFDDLTRNISVDLSFYRLAEPVPQTTLEVTSDASARTALPIETCGSLTDVLEFTDALEGADVFYSRPVGAPFAGDTILTSTRFNDPIEFVYDPIQLEYYNPNFQQYSLVTWPNELNVSIPGGEFPAFEIPQQMFPGFEALELGWTNDNDEPITLGESLFWNPSDASDAVWVDFGSSTDDSISVHCHLEDDGVFELDNRVLGLSNSLIGNAAFDNVTITRQKIISHTQNDAVLMLKRTSSQSVLFN